MKKYLKFRDSPRTATKVTPYLSVQFGIDLQIKRGKKKHYGAGIHSTSLMLGFVQSGSPTEAAAALCPGVQPYQGQARIPTRHTLRIYT